MLLKLAPTVNNEMHFMDSKAGNAKVPQSITEYGYPKFLYNRKQKTTQTQLKDTPNTCQRTDPEQCKRVGLATTYNPLQWGVQDHCCLKLNELAEA